MDLSAAEGRCCPCECVAAREIAAIISGRAADVFVVQAADHGHGDDVPVVIGHDRAVVRGVLAQGQVGACGVIIGNVLGQNAMQMSFAEDDDVVETLPADGSDHAFAVRILPGKGVDDLLCGPARGPRR